MLNGLKENLDSKEIKEVKENKFTVTKVKSKPTSKKNSPCKKSNQYRFSFNVYNNKEKREEDENRKGNNFKTILELDNNNQKNIINMNKNLSTHMNNNCKNSIDFRNKKINSLQNPGTIIINNNINTININLGNKTLFTMRGNNNETLNNLSNLNNLNNINNLNHCNNINDIKFTKRKRYRQDGNSELNPYSNNYTNGNNSNYQDGLKERNFLYEDEPLQSFNELFNMSFNNNNYKLEENENDNFENFLILGKTIKNLDKTNINKVNKEFNEDDIFYEKVSIALMIFDRM